jgi:predicted esterase
MEFGSKTPRNGCCPNANFHFYYIHQLEKICIIQAIPTQIFHRRLEDVVNVDYATTIYKELKKCNKNVELTFFNDFGHDCRTQVYDNTEIYN